jgi:hypothetical protein
MPSGPPFDAFLRGIRRKEVKSQDVKTSRSEAFPHAAKVCESVGFRKEMAKTIERVVSGIHLVAKGKLPHVRLEENSLEAPAFESAGTVGQSGATEIKADHPKTRRCQLADQPATSTGRL